MADHSPNSPENLWGISLMIAGMASGAAVDAAIKAMSQHADTLLIASVVGFGMASVFAASALQNGQSLFPSDMLHPAVVLRTVCEVLGIYGTVLALSLVTLTAVTALAQTVPLLVTLGAVLFLGERASRRDWVVLAIGLVGMLLIVKPTSDGFEPATLIAVSAAIVLAARDLASRVVPPSVSTLQLGIWGGVALGFGSLSLAYFTRIHWPEVSMALVLGLVLIVFLASTTFYCITAAMRLGDVAVISPFRYTRLLFGVLLGMIIFGEALDIATAVGAIAIAGCGLYVWWREVFS
ncbi:MAG: DMT family transporter [Paracoccaceae bacterium]|nr:DMT family transporter [Paracoccaceae bacterium]